METDDKKIQPKRIKTPTVLQMEMTECGAASLTMVLAYYGLWLPLEKVRDISGVSRDGLNAGNIARTARLFGCEAKGCRWKAEWLREKQAPLILYWEFNHFVVFEGIEGDTVYLNDPAMGHRKLPFSKFEESYTGMALQVTPGEDFQKGGKPYSVAAVLKKKLLQDKSAALFVLLSSFCLVVPTLAVPAISQVFIDDILSGKHLDWIFNASLFLGGMLFLTLALQGVRLWVLTSWQNKLDLTDSSRFFRHVIRLPMQFFSQRSGSEVASRVSLNAGVAQVLTGQAATAALDLFMVAFYLFLLLQYNAKLTLLGVFFTAVNVTAFLYLRENLKELLMQVQQDNGKEFATAINGIAQIETLKANGNEDDFFARWAGYHTKVLASSQEVQKYNLLLQFLPLLTAGMETALLMTVGGFDIMDGMMSTGIFLAFNGLMGNFQQPVANLLNLGNSLQTTEMCMRRLEDVMQYEEDSFSFPNESVPSIGRGALWGEVELRDMTFGYNRAKPPLFTNFNMHLYPGDWVALVGGSGCGKSTIAKLIEGVYEEWSGQVLFDGILRRQVPVDVFHNSLAVVSQDVSLIRGTVEENITLYDSSVRHQDVVRAAMDACIYDDILNLPKGFETQVLEGGVNFSGGQRQRLEIARALATNPSILILDEATSALDTVTEERVIENIRHRGCTSILVAHRLSTIRDCDEIIVLDSGNVVERGRHGDLMALDGEYAKLVRNKD